MKYECALCHCGIAEEGMSYCEECWIYWLLEQDYWEKLEEKEQECWEYWLLEQKYWKELEEEEDEQ